MDSANASRQDPEKAAYTLALPSSEAETPKPKSSKMLRIRQATLMLLAVAIIAFTVVSATGNPGSGIARISISSADRQRFQELLNSVEPSALHNVLHAAEDKYRHGIFKEDRNAMEVVHQENAEVATSLVELAKRQAGSNTTTVVETTSNSVVDPTTSPGTTSQIPTVDPTTSETSQAPPPATSPTTPPTVEQTPTTSDAPTTPPTVQNSAQPTSPTTQPTLQQTTAPAPTTSAPAPSTSAGQSTNGTFNGGLAAYPFAPPLSTPSYASHVQNSSSVPPTTLPSFGPYVLFKNVSSSGISTESQSFTCVPPVLTSIAISTIQITIEAPALFLSANASPDSLSPFYSSSQITSVVFHTFTSSSNNSSLPAHTASFAPYTTIQTETTVSTITGGVAVPAASLVPVLYIPIQNNSLVATSSAAQGPSSLAQNSTFIASIFVSPDRTLPSNASSFTIAMLSSSGSFFNNSISGASPTPSSTTGSSTPSSSNPTTPLSSSTRGGATSSIIIQSSVSSRRQSSNEATVRASSTLSRQASSDNNPKTTSARSVTQQTILTTTLANGAVETVTQITVVAGQADQTDGPPAGTSSAKGSLQTNGASIKNIGRSGLLGALGLVVAGAL